MHPSADSCTVQLLWAGWVVHAGDTARGQAGPLTAEAQQGRGKPARVSHQTEPGHLAPQAAAPWKAQEGSGTVHSHWLQASLCPPAAITGQLL